MGVLGLWQILESIGHPIKLEGLEGKRLGVDANVWLYKFIRGFRDKDNAAPVDSHKLGLFNRISKLLFYKIKPVFVFDGPAPVLKRKTLERRQNLRSKNLMKVQDAAVRILADQLKKQYPDARVDDLKIHVPHLRSNGLVAAEKLTDEDASLFYLPPEPEKVEQEESESEEETFWLGVQKVDFESEDFKSMPAEVRYELLHNIKEEKKRIRNPDTLPEDAGSFSNYQLQRLKDRRSIQEKIEQCEKDICSMYTGESVLTYRMQSDPSSTMLYIDNRSQPKVNIEEKLGHANDRTGNITIKTDASKVSLTQQSCSNAPNNVTIDISSEEEELIEDAGPSLSRQLQQFQDERITQERIEESQKNIESSSPIILTDDETSSSTELDESTVGVIDEPKIHVSSSMSDSVVADEKLTDEEVDPPHSAAVPEIDEKKDSSSESEEETEWIGVQKIDSDSDDNKSMPTEISSEFLHEIEEENKEIRNSYKMTEEVGPSSSQQSSNRKTDNVTINIADDDDDEEEEVLQLSKGAGSPSKHRLQQLEDEQSKSSSTTIPVSNSQPQPQARDNVDERSSQSDTRSRDTEYRTAEPRSLTSQQATNLRNANKVTTKIVEEAKELLRLFGIPYIDAAGEAEAQCALLEELNLTEGTITDDSDIWLFGAKNVYRYFFSDDKYVMQYKSTDIEYHLRLTRQDLVCFAMLVGSDYTDGIMNVGQVTALEILSEFRGTGLEPLIKFKEWRDNYDKKTKITPRRRKLLKFHLPENFPSKPVFDGYMRPMADSSTEQFSWGTPDLDELREYARRNFAWDIRKIDEKLLPVMKKLNERKTQPTIDSFFFKTAANQNPELFRSKRVNEALSKLAKQDIVLLSEEEEDTDAEDDGDDEKKQKSVKKRTRNNPKKETSAKTSRARSKTKSTKAVKSSPRTANANKPKRQRRTNK